MKVYQIYLSYPMIDGQWEASKPPYLSKKKAEEYADSINALTDKTQCRAKVEEETLWFSDEPGYDEYVSTL